MKRALMPGMVLVMFSACGLWRSAFPASSPWHGFKMPGVCARAGGIALHDHLEELRKQQEALPPEIRRELPPGADKLNACMRRPEAYDVYVDFNEKQDLYDVTIVPNAEVCLGKDADALRGGGAKYEIDAETFVIKKKALME